jgi:flagellar protein FlaG
MIIPNLNGSQTTQATRHVSSDAPRVAVKPANNAPAPEVAAGEKAAREKAAREKGLAKQQPSPEQLKSAVETLNTVLKLSNNSLEFSIDDETHKPIVKLVDTVTGELIRQYPSDETLAISRSIDSFQQGFLLKQEA